jgi:pimeloyl-ACP methyl ester carboxylesterase
MASIETAQRDSFEPKTMFIHGLEGSGHGSKAQILQKAIPGIVVPEFSGDLIERMDQLRALLDSYPRWRLIGSYLGALMATLYAAEKPNQVERMILLAPAFNRRYFQSENNFPAIQTPVTIIQGVRDDVEDIERIQDLTPRIFPHGKLIPVDDDHQLQGTTERINWASLVNP